MKQFAILLGVFLIGASVHAQESPQKTSEQYSTIFGKTETTQFGWYIGVESGFTTFDKKNVWLCGMSGGMIINHNFTLGLTGRAYANREQLYFEDITDTSGAYLAAAYGAVLLEYTLFPNSPVHLTFPVLIGGGGATYVSEKEYKVWDDDEWETEHEFLDDDAFFVIEPGVRVEVNLLKFMRLNAGVSYHYTSGLDMINTPGDLMNNFTASVGLKFGKF